MREVRDTWAPSARQRLREVHDRQAAAVAALEARAVKAHRALAELEAEQTGALGELAAELTGFTTGKAREALTARRRQGADTAAADGAARARRALGTTCMGRATGPGGGKPEAIAGGEAAGHFRARASP